MAEIYRAKEAFSFEGVNGVPRVIAPGNLISSDDPDFKGKEHLFEPVETSVASEQARRTGVEDASARTAVEDASAEPNARRSVSTTSTQKPTTVARVRGGKE